MAQKLHNNADFTAWDERNRPWALDFATELVSMPGATNQNIHDALEQARLLTNGEDLTAAEILGEPQDAAREAFTDIDTSLGITENRVETTASSMATGCFIAFILSLVIILFASENWMVKQADNLVFIVLMLIISYTAGMTGFNYFKRGMMGAAVASVLAGIALLAATCFTIGIWAFDTDNSWQIPTLLALGINLLLLVVSGWFVFSAPSLLATPVDSRDWFVRYEGALRGQHLYSKAEARALVEEARAHVAESASDPGEEFGDPAAYAEKMAGKGTRSITRRFISWIIARAISAFALLAICYSMAARAEWSGLAFYWAVGVAILAIVTFITGYRRDRTKRDAALAKAADDEF
ncbi:hypothetical protein [Rothia sp. ZJ932]|uniref:hypothetical protein n=1 Tax=Rothia sp. ZJ932 TaxID=2810516 RepID=UPI001966D494|nr:hypothetical protein [Rothia sp. ZJ932]QRZ61416.1 hypothetical protein JR346_09365 [Rothia sp. ZJ932]